ncbi:unnamed protein product [Nippostrongylus brasiliensis]|uniref:CCHC-type domain-containing protein n=1 Tax=Nippostrongylus brasiliensis TaxID=27835 RepID=A0A0N4YFS7_NIPBR|nr:unnamed protein product [Nippostrongylus brasiliensis]
MSARDPDDDVKFLSSLMLDIQEDQTNRVTRVCKELQQIREAFNHEVSAAALIHLQWNYIVTEENFVLGTPAFRILTTDKQLRNMLSTRERFSRLASRFVYITRIYRDLHIAANWTKGAKWKTEAEAIIVELEKNRTRFDAVIKDMETELQKAEKDFREGPCTASAEHVNALFRRAFENLKGTNQDKTDKKIAELQALVEAQASELANIKKKIGEEKETTTSNEESDANDEKYFQVMLKEVKDDTEPDLETSFDENEELIVRSEADQSQEDPVETEPEAPSDQEETRQANQRKRPRQEEHRTRNAERIQELKSRVARMKIELPYFPFRLLEFQIQGVNGKIRCSFCATDGKHYSDSCPIVVNGDERWKIIQQTGGCQFCLLKCNDHQRCAYAGKPCFYCERVKGSSFEWLIPKDGGHHRALCNIPDKRREAQRRIENLQEEIEELSKDGNPQRQREKTAR